MFIILASIALFLFIWAFFIETNLLIIKKITINDPELKGIRVAYLSDLHICEDQEKYFQNMVKKVNEQNPDVILLGGDYVVNKILGNKSMKPDKIADLLKELNAKYGVYMVMGNHEKSKKTLKEFSNKLIKSNITILQNKNTKINIKGKEVYIVGIGDISCKRHKINIAFKDVKTPVIAFTHSPDVFPLIPDYVNMTFAGHTHGGQVYIPLYGPAASPTNLLGKYIKGFYNEDGKKMFVSSGIGATHLRVRFFNLPEIVIADFK